MAISRSKSKGNIKAFSIPYMENASSLKSNITQRKFSSEQLAKIFTPHVFHISDWCLPHFWFNAKPVDLMELWCTEFLAFHGEQIRVMQIHGTGHKCKIIPPHLPLSVIWGELKMLVLLLMELLSSTESHHLFKWISLKYTIAALNTCLHTSFKFS